MASASALGNKLAGRAAVRQEGVAGMSREIKFRAWSHDRKVMVPVRAVDWDEKGKVISLNYPTGKLYPNDTFGDHVALMQYTGFTDALGKEIYEGDIIHCVNGWDDEYTCEVRWEGEHDYPAFDLTPSINDEINSLADLYCGDWKLFEVIGNIYENPELVKGAN